MAITIVEFDELVDPEARVNDMLRLLQNVRGEGLPNKPEIPTDRGWIEKITAEFQQKFGMPKIAKARKVLKKMALHAKALGDLYIRESDALMLNFATNRLDDTQETRDAKWEEFQAMTRELINDGHQLKQKSRVFYETATTWDERDTGSVHSVNEMARGSLKAELVEVAKVKFQERRGQIGGTSREDFITFARLLYENILEKPLKKSELIRACNEAIANEIAERKEPPPTD